MFRYILLLCLLASAASADELSRYGPGPSGGGGGNGPTALDCGGGNCGENSGFSVASVSVTLSTTNSGNLIGCPLTINTSLDVTPTFSSTNTTSWTLVGRSSAADTNHIELWWGKATAALSSESITATFPGGAPAGFAALTCFGVHLGDTTSPSDGFASGTSDPVSLTTAGGHDFLVCAMRENGVATTPGTGWTQIPGNNPASTFQFVEYQADKAAGTYSCSQSGASVNGVVTDGFKAS